MARSTRTARTQLAQLSLFRRGGARKRAGRKPKGGIALASHATRARVTRHTPVHVSTHLVDGLPSMRSERLLAIVRDTLSAGSDRFGFHLVECSVQSNHLHLVAEAPDEKALARGVKGLLVRVAKAINRALGRTGRVIRDRYVARVLAPPRDVRSVLVYVLQNAKKHGARILGIDACSSGPWFDGWIDRSSRAGRTLPEARSWLLAFGWKERGLISVHEGPRGSAELDRSELDLSCGTESGTT